MRLLIPLALLLTTTTASHFRFASLSWKPVSDGTGLTVQFTFDSAWRASYFAENSVVPGVYVAPVGNIDFGDGNLDYIGCHISSNSSSDDYFTGEDTITHTYASVNNGGVAWMVRVFACCRVDYVLHHPEDAFQVETTVDLTPANGIVNTSPMIGMYPVVTVIASSAAQFTLMGQDADGDVLSYRLSTFNESSLDPDPNMSMNNATGVLTWNATGYAAGYYPISATVSDGKSKSTVDFIANLRLSNSFCSSTCSNPSSACSSNGDCSGCANGCVANVCPTIGTPTQGSTIAFTVGVLSTFSVQASDTSSTPDLRAGPLPINAIFPLLSSTSTTLTKEVRWSPVPNQAGLHLACFDAVDGGGCEVVTCVSLRVTDPGTYVTPISLPTWFAPTANITIPPQSSACFTGTERDALILINSRLGGNYWFNSQSWNNLPVTPFDYCSWHGVECYLGLVSELVLPSNNLTGTIDCAIGRLTELARLDLTDNAISGTFPSILSFMRNLRILKLGGNKMTGTIPSSLGTLPRINDIDLSWNQFTGSVPTLGAAAELAVVQLDYNSLTGTALPTDFALMNALRVYTVSNNKIPGSIPSALFQLPRLTLLDLSNNLLTSTIPATIALPNAMIIKLGFNSLSGAVPTALGSLPIVDQLDVSHNSLSSTLPLGLWGAGGQNRSTVIDLRSNSLNTTLCALTAAAYKRAEMTVYC